ncbi:MAG: hypothetical protein IPQ05_24635 [Leptospiraceae bacterium]|jgi:hypothetical protein|nr:hypothetical protein [Leptospiraceae bacterium]MBL0266945.1 hypothetical protein [Leptospiraceae bacterium]MBP9890167.1 hypothetical protein [Leptospiraceae bacterium]
MEAFNIFNTQTNLRKIFFLTAFFLLSLTFCDLENRYPDAGEFCTPMKEVPECVQMDFRNKNLILSGSASSHQNKIFLRMINRVEYEHEFENSKMQIDVLSEYRIRIRTLKLPESTLEKEETYIRMKGPKISLWTRIKKAWNKKD